ncbi:MAG: GNAT family N-acetyltransferase [Anaerolineaceae bacterium]|nr:GNAT family N-acetyltransferase [Anaerolineaceae bacterium]
MSTIAAPGSRSADGLRPVNLRSDLGELADLIELVFSPGMDRAGREAVRDMRLLGRSGLAVLPGMSDVVQGMGQGYVWVEQGRLVGNISLFASNRPQADTWLIANVGVHPGFRRRGIGDRLVAAAVAQVRRRGGRLALLQVDCDNEAAQRLYERRGFHVERAWTHWRRDASIRSLPDVEAEGPRISNLRRGEWQAEYDMAQRLRPMERGGLGWQRPLRRDEFRRPLSRRLNDWLNMRGQERLVVRTEDDRRLLASLWIDHGLLTASTQLTLFADQQRLAANAALLLGSAVRRHGIGRHSLLLEHPADEQAVNGVLRSLYFRPLREVLHMRLDLAS